MQWRHVKSIRMLFSHFLILPIQRVNFGEKNTLGPGGGHGSLREIGNSPMKIECWAGTGFSWDFVQGGAQPKGPAGEIPGRALPERIRGVPLGVVQGARAARRGRQPDAQGAALLVRVGRGWRMSQIKRHIFEWHS